MKKKYPKYLKDCEFCGKAIIAKNAGFDKPSRKFCSLSCITSSRNKYNNPAKLDNAKEKFKKRIVHGYTQNKETLHLLKIWSEMVRRCTSKKCKSYPNYGGRGIKVVDLWLDKTNFFNDMVPGYKIGLSIDRIDNNGNYCKENCRWVPKSEQSKNRRASNEWKYKKIK